MTKHTPGPWKYDGQGDGNKQLPIRSRGNIIAAIRGSGTLDDARLIAAAPDLLAALHELAEIGEGGVIERRETGKPTWIALKAVATIARAAIAKAETEQQ